MAGEGMDARALAACVTVAGACAAVALLAWHLSHPVAASPSPPASLASPSPSTVYVRADRLEPVAGRPPYPADPACIRREEAFVVSKIGVVGEDPRFPVCIDGRYTEFDNVARCYADYPHFKSYSRGACPRVA